MTDMTITGGTVAAGGGTVNPATGGYSLTLDGDIFYSAGQADVCSAPTTTAAP